MLSPIGVGGFRSTLRQSANISGHDKLIQGTGNRTNFNSSRPEHMKAGMMNNRQTLASKRVLSFKKEISTVFIPNPLCGKELEAFSPRKDDVTDKYVSR